MAEPDRRYWKDCGHRYEIACHCGECCKWFRWDMVLYGEHFHREGERVDPRTVRRDLR